MSEEIMLEAAGIANNIVKTDKQYTKLIATMLASRQLYAFCIHELELLLADNDQLKNYLPDKEITDEHKTIIREVLINAAASQAANPFEENTLIDALNKLVLPWVTTVAAKHNKIEKSANEEGLKKVEIERRSKLLPLALPILDEPEIDRAKSIVLIGEKPVVDWAVSKLNDNFKEDTAIQTVLLSGNAAANLTFNHYTVPKQAWNMFGVNKESIKRLFLGLIVNQVSNPPDVLIVSNLLSAFNSDTALWAAKAAEVQKNLQSIAAEAGFLLVSGVALDRPVKPNELHQTEYESLKLFNVLRAVTTKSINDSECMVCIGNKEYGPVLSSEIYGA